MKSFLKFIWILWGITFTTAEIPLDSKDDYEESKANEMAKSHEYVMSKAHLQSRSNR